MKRSIALALGLLALLPVTSALAHDHPQELPGWEPAPFSSFTLAAGTFCPFTIQVDILRNDAIGAITKSFPDGTPEQQVLMGPQLIRLINVETGRSTETFLDGIQIFDYEGDGSFTLTNIGKNMVAFLDGDNFPAGFYFVDGYNVVQYTPTGTGYSREMLSAIGVQTSYCQTLSGHKHH